MNHSNRRSSFIQEKEAKVLIGAAAHAWRTGFPLNKAITIHLKMMKVSNAQAFVTDLFERHGWHLRGTEAKSCWLAVLEDGGKGLHVHAAVHVPAARLEGYHWHVAKWVRNITGNKIPKNAIRVKKIKFSEDTWSYSYLGVGNQNQRSGLKGWIWYLLKGIDPQAAPRFHLRHTPQGIILNKRCQLAVCLQPNAIKKWEQQHPLTIPYAHKPGVSVTTEEAIKERVLLYAGLTEASGYEAA
jgi:hypothetical protein